jgi:hypothetical protein
MACPTRLLLWEFFSDIDCRNSLAHYRVFKRPLWKAVLGALTFGKIIYDLDMPHFGEQEFELTEELADWAG